MKFALILAFAAFTLIAGTQNAQAMLTEKEIKDFCKNNVPKNYALNRFRQPNGDKAVKPVLWLKDKKTFSNGITIEVFKDKKHYLVVLPTGDSAGGCTRQQLSEILVDNDLLPKELDGKKNQLPKDEMKFLYVNEYDIVKYYPRSSSSSGSGSSNNNLKRDGIKPVPVQQR